jgi:hypothetical protein
MTDTTKATLLTAAVITGTILLISAMTTSSPPPSTMTLSPNQVFAQQQTTAGDSLVVQNTSASKQDPVPGHAAHQLVLVAPPRQDGKVWAGVVTFTASKPVEVVVLHPYNKPQTANQTTGEPLNAPNPFAPGKNIAITLMTKQTDRPIFSGSLPFAGTALAFHTTNGEPFVVTYTVVAEAKSPTTTTT